jgi:ABC-type sugar transport system ATPase subunit
MATVEITDLSKDYGSIKALDNVTHTFDSSRVHALIGKNGSGKSTLVKVLSGAVSPTRGKMKIGGKPAVFRSLGAGRTELLRAIFGAEKIEAGEILLDGTAIHDPSPAKMTGLGLGYTPENRKEEGLIQDASIHANLSLASLRQIAPKGLISRRAEEPGVARQIEDMHIKVGSPDDPVCSLSGGNQQKVVIGNWLNTHPRILFYNEPSRGVDVHAKQQVFRIIWEQAQRGVSAIFVSTELEEVRDVCDRILVMREGAIIGELDPATTTLTELYSACMGDS